MRLPLLLLFLIAVSLAAAPLSAPAPVPSALRALRWRPEGQSLVVEVEMSGRPTARFQDLTASKRYVYLDLFHADPVGASAAPLATPLAVATYGAYAPDEYAIASPLIFHVKRIYYGPQRVLRYVFYARGALAARVTQLPGNVVRLTFSPAGAAEPYFQPAYQPRSFQSVPPADGTRKRVVIDPGHGGHSGDPVNATGAETREPVDGEMHYEKELTLQIAGRLKTMIDRTSNMQAFLTRTGDYAVTLPDRIDASYKYQGDCFVSIHLNATDSPSQNGRGFEIYYLDDTNKATNKLLLALENDENINLRDQTSGDESLREILRGLADDSLRQRQAESADLAASIDDQFRRLGPFRAYHRGVKGAAFRVLMNFQMPAILLEAGFIDNPEEAPELVHAKSQEKIAALIFNGINRYFAKADPRFSPSEASVN